ncbi:unnamed protein product [Caenorhabditis angaria]|uniref:Phorbol-ester/DAG-type domain-containing protein n=1 Tax=Caenorhabditis angaria TaxID=860376 RepID=A0A9P1IMP8_9PELO|nr:unnamed protein product [Caenorhabditis angaria]
MKICNANRFEKPSTVSVQRAESARVPQLLVSQPSCDLRRTQSESRLDAKVIDAVLASTSDFAIEEPISQMFIGSLNRSRDPLDSSHLNVIKKEDKDRTLTQADAAKGLSMFTENTGSVVSLSSMASTRTDTEGDIGPEDDETSSLSRKRQNSTRRNKIQATLAAGKKRVLDLMPQKRKENDLGGESIEYATDAGTLLLGEGERDKSPATEKVKKEKKMKKKDSPKSLHFDIDVLKYLNVTVQARECVTSEDSPASGSSSGSASTPGDLITLGTCSLYIPQLIDDCKLTLSNCHREVFVLKQPNFIEAPTSQSQQQPDEFSRHAGFDPRLCFGDITLGFRYFPNGLPTGKALNSGEESDEEMVKVTPETPTGRPFSPPALSPSTHDWKLWYGGRTSTVCAMCRGKIWLRNASCCSRCLVICHNKCVVKANQGGIACSPHQTATSDANFEDLSLPEPNEAGTPSTEILEELVMQSPSSNLPETPDISKRARFKKVTEKFSNWRKGSSSSARKENDRLSQCSNDSKSHQKVQEEDQDRDSPMASIQDVLSDVLPFLDGSPFIHGLYFQPGNAYNEQTIRNAKQLGREIYSELPSDIRIEKINSQIDRIQTAIRETKDDRLNVMQNGGGETSARFQGLDERLQALAVLMLHYCSALQDCQSGRSTPAPPNFDETKIEPDAESVLDEDTVVGDIPTRPDQLISPT